MNTVTKEKLKPGHLNDGTQLEPGQKIFCDPEYQWDDFDAGKTPKLKIPANVLDVKSSIAKVEIIDEVHNSKRKFTNTDLYGCTTWVLLHTVTREA